MPDCLISKLSRNRFFFGVGHFVFVFLFTSDVVLAFFSSTFHFHSQFLTLAALSAIIRSVVVDFFFTVLNLYLDSACRFWRCFGAVYYN